MATETVYICDRCGTDYQTKTYLSEVSLQSKVSESSVIRSVDLCLDCTGDFWHEFVKTESVRTYSPDDF